MTTIYLHIGTHKTGTTTIQKFLSRNRQNLLSKRVLYPSSPVSHHDLLQNKGKDKPWGLNFDAWEYLLKEIKSEKPDKAVISSENFSRLYFEDVSKVRDYMSEFRPKIIVYLRRQDEYFASLYCQAIKTAHHWDSVKKHILDNKAYADYYKILEPWKKAFGKENIIVRVYEKEQLPEGLLNDFLQSINLDAHKLDFKKGQSSNISPSIKKIKIIRLLNNITIGMMSIEKKKVTGLSYRFLISENPISRLIERLPNFLISNELMSTQERINLLKEFEESNQKVAKEYLGRQDGKLFYSTPV